MTTSTKPTTKRKQIVKSPDAGFIWFTGFIGAFIYYVEQADNFVMGIVALLKAIVWPAFLVYKLLG